MVAERKRKSGKHVQPVTHTFYQKGVVILTREITYTNRVRIGDQRVALDELPKKQQELIADSLIYRPLMTIADVNVVRSA